uniref:Bacteriocin n=1 Tax=viral metagenome TaxID=1070528 RepID=A0A6M3ID96_9ZZZZ
MAGLISTGTGYRNQALSGFIRQSAEEAAINKTNEQLKQAKKQQQMSMATSGAAAGAMLGAMGAAKGGATVGGLWGAGIGLVAGFLLSELF